jgi:hypothetical protein
MEGEMATTTNLSRGERARLHRRRVARLERRQQRQQQQLAAQRHQISGVGRVLPALQEIEAAQQRLRKAGENLHVVLAMRPLAAEAYGEFQRHGGVSATDWVRWLAGVSGASLGHASRRHLRIVSVCSTPLQPRHVEQEPPLAEVDFAEPDYDPDPEAA